MPSDALWTIPLYSLRRSRGKVRPPTLTVSHYWLDTIHCHLGHPYPDLCSDVFLL